ncbi:MAG: PAS domain-containing protein, partial [Casimicrobium sp.]
SVLESIDVPIVRVAPDMTVLYCNTPYAQFAGKKTEEIVGRQLSSFLGDEAAALIEPYSRRALAGESVVFDRQVTHLQPPRWIRVRLQPDRDASGVARAVLCSVYDIDADVRAREALEDARRRLDVFTDSIPFPLTYLDREANYRFANRAFLERHRLALDQVLGKHPREARSETVWNEHREYVERAMAGETCSYERPVMLADGQSRWTRTTYAPDIAPDGSIQGVYTSSHDIHELKRAQSEIARVDARLAAHLARSPVAVVEYDWTGTIVQWSNRTQEILGYTSEEMLGRKLTTDLVHEDDRQEIADVVKEILSGKSEIVVNTHRYRHREGRYVWIEWYTSILYNENNRIDSIVSLGIDRTERTEARMRVQRLADRIPNPITYVGTDLRYQFMNKTFVEWIGITPEQMIGKTPTEVRGAQLGGVFEDLIRRALAGEETSIERKAMLADGRERWVKTLFTPDYDDQRRIVGVYNVSFDVHEDKLREEMLQIVANEDPLTGALTRRAFFAELDRVLHAADGGAVTLLFADLDGFKAINDGFGHAVGDDVLTEIYRRCKACIGAKDVIGRFGGDEFVIMTRAATQLESEGLARKLIAAVESHRLPQTPEMRLSASVGIA